jgi:hypothetical protein
VLPPFSFQGTQHFLDFQIAVHDLLLIDAVQISRLTEGKQMLGPPVAF